jgi:hypothetical protein
MLRKLGIIIGAMLPLLSHAQEFTMHDGFVLSAEEGTWRERGVARPTVTYDATAEEYVMFFTARFPDAYVDGLGGDYSDCSAGVYGIGRATSPNGIDWTPDPDDAPVIAPVPGTYRACHVAQGTVVKDGDTWRLWFKSEQGANACPGDEELEWGCDRFTGISYAESSDGVNWTVNDLPILSNTAWGSALGIGFPSVVKLEGQWILYASSIPNIYMARSEQPGSGWIARAEPLLEPGANDWMQDRVFCPALNCDEEESLPFTFWFGGKDLEGQWGFGKASAEGPAENLDDPIEVYVSSSSPFFTWEAADNQNRWTNYDVLRIGEDDWVIYFKAKDDNNNPAIGMAYTVSSWDGADMHNRICETVVTDEDGDGYDGLAYDGTDCNDNDATINPGADEIWYDGIDQNCDDNDSDQDLDGFDAEETGGDDCDDEDPDINPSVADPYLDGIDRDCDGVDGQPDSGDTGPGVPGGGEGCCKNDGSDGTAALFLLPLLLLRRRQR